MNRRIFAALACFVALVSSVSAQTKSVAVSNPTRLDWEFAARSFGRDAARLPPDYDSKKQRYQLFVPETYHRTTIWPLIVFLSPSNVPFGWEYFAATSEREGILFCSPFKAGNKVAAGTRIRIVLDMIDDVRRKYRIDPDQTYIGGFSGGGRISCSVGFAFPEVFAGVMPVCGTNPPDGLTYLRHRLVDRMSVAFVTGEGDVNRRENAEWMAPFFKEVGIRSTLMVVPGVGHDMPGPAVMDQVVAWLAEDLERRREDSRLRPNLHLRSDEAFGDDVLAKRLLDAARAELKDEKRIWQGVALLQGIVNRWPESTAAAGSRDLLQETLADKSRREILDSIRLPDERQAAEGRARGLERLGRIPRAIDVWENLAENYPDSALAEEARLEIRRLQAVEPAPAILRGKRR